MDYRLLAIEEALVEEVAIQKATMRCWSKQTLREDTTIKNYSWFMQCDNGTNTNTTLLSIYCTVMSGRAIVQRKNAGNNHNNRNYRAESMIRRRENGQQYVEGSIKRRSKAVRAV